MNPNISVSQDRIADFCRDNGIAQLAIFGSALREDFGPQSDVDILVRFEDGVRHTLFDMNRMEEELKSIFGREIDLVSWCGIERSANYLRRKIILESAESIYGP